MSRELEELPRGYHESNRKFGVRGRDPVTRFMSKSSFHFVWSLKHSSKPNQNSFDEQSALTKTWTCNGIRRVFKNFRNSPDRKSNSRFATDCGMSIDCSEGQSENCVRRTHSRVGYTNRDNVRQDFRQKRECKSTKARKGAGTNGLRFAEVPTEFRRAEFLHTSCHWNKIRKEFGQTRKCKMIEVRNSRWTRPFRIYVRSGDGRNMNKNHTERGMQIDLSWESPKTHYGKFESNASQWRT
jgi:hypothetical protein